MSSIIYPASRKEVVDRVKTDFQNALPASEPFLRNSTLAAICTALGGEGYDLYLQIQKLQSQIFLDTATGDFADRWASYKNVIRESASPSIGFATATGVDNTLIPTGTGLQSSDGIQYKTIDNETIKTQALAVFGLTRSGQTATATTVSPHLLADGLTVTISGADQTEYNITARVVVTSNFSFTYTITGTPVTPATGTILVNITYASLEIISNSFGSNTKQDSGAELNFSTLIAGVNASAFVQFDGLTEGTDLESDTDFRNRYLEVYRNPIALFNDQAIISQAKLVNGVTRVFVEDNTPDTGQVTIYFTRDNDANIIPNTQEVADVNKSILLIKPAPDNPADVIVSAPTPILIDFIFSTLDPNTSTMQDAITASLQAMFKDVPIVGQNLSEYAYLSAIFQTVDPTTGKFVTSFTLTSPTGDISVGSDELPIFNSVTFP